MCLEYCTRKRIEHNNTKRFDTLFFLDVADTPEKARIGLSHRFSLDENKGMLFSSHDSHITMWMKDTYIPLDMVFFDETGRIVDIYTAQPLDLTPISPKQPVAGVVELVGGICEKLGIKKGNMMQFIE